MNIGQLVLRTLVCLWICGTTVPVSAQIVEAVGNRALGMGGAFVAVASDSSATWWNPAGLAAGPFLDLSLAVASTEVSKGLPAWRHRAAWFALSLPPAGFSYYRLRITDIQPSSPISKRGAGREDRSGEVPVRSLSASQIGVTLVQTLIPGIHAGTTLKYLRGTLRRGLDDGLQPATAIARGEALEGGNAYGAFDLDIGLLAVGGPLRLGLLVRNLRQPQFEPDSGDPRTRADDQSAERVLRFPRQIRIGTAFDAEEVGGVPLTVAVDVDVRRYATTAGDRRLVAFGAERWFLARRFGVRAGGRINTVGAQERSLTAGVSVAVRPGLYVDGHGVLGGSADEQGWGVAARVSF